MARGGRPPPRPAGPASGCRRPSRRCWDPRRRRRAACGRGPTGRATAVRAVADGDQARLPTPQGAPRRRPGPSPRAAPRSPRRRLIQVSQTVTPLPAASPSALTTTGRPRRRVVRRRPPRGPRWPANAHERAIGTPAARRRRGRTPCSISIRAAAAVGPKTAMPASAERRRCPRERRLRARPRRVRPRSPARRDDSAAVERIDVPEAHGRAARRRSRRSRARRSPRSRRARRSASRRARARARHRRRSGPGSASRPAGSRRHPWPRAHRPPGPLDRLGPLGPTETSTIGTPACSSMAVT